MTTLLLDWDDIRFVLAVMRRGTLLRAASELKVTQPTVGRRIDALERRLGVKLFRRLRSGYLALPEAESVRAYAERMEGEAEAFERALAQRDEVLRGTLRVTASEWLAARVLAPIAARFVARYPGITIELVADARWLNLPRREADIAFRHTRFEHATVFQREVARIAFGLYASPSYLAECGLPDADHGGVGHRLAAMSEEQVPIADAAWLRSLLPRAAVVARANGREVLANMAAAGIGVACLPRLLGDSFGGLRRVLGVPPIPTRKLWLGVHRDSRALARVKAFSAFAAEAITDQAEALNPAN